MRKLTTLSRFDEKALCDVLDYFLFDDKEKDDFIQQYGEDYFNDEMILQLDLVDGDAESHIYYKVCYLMNELSHA